MKNKKREIYEPTDNEDFMNSKQLEYFKKSSSKLEKEILRESSNTLDHLKEESSNKPDNADRASIESERSLELRTRDRERKLLNKIEKALRKLKMVPTATVKKPINRFQLPDLKQDQLQHCQLKLRKCTKNLKKSTKKKNINFLID